MNPLAPQIHGIAARNLNIWSQVAEKKALIDAQTLVIVSVISVFGIFFMKNWQELSLFFISNGEYIQPFSMCASCSHADFVCVLRIMAFLFGEEVLRIILK